MSRMKIKLKPNQSIRLNANTEIRLISTGVNSATLLVSTSSDTFISLDKNTKDKSKKG